MFLDLQNFRAGLQGTLATIFLNLLIMQEIDKLETYER